MFHNWLLFAAFCNDSLQIDAVFSFQGVTIVFLRLLGLKSGIILSGLDLGYEYFEVRCNMRVGIKYGKLRLSNVALQTSAIVYFSDGLDDDPHPDV